MMGVGVTLTATIDMATRLPYRGWKPDSPGDAIVGHVLYFDNPEDGTSTCVIRSHGVFYRLSPEITVLINARKPSDGALVLIEYQPGGYRLSVLCEYQKATKKQRRRKQYTTHARSG